MGKTFADFASAEKFLCELRNAGSKYSLERIAAFCRALGNPQEQYPTVHVAGTNGKGSVCAMLDRIFRAVGLRTGMYTSPHLVYLGERIQIDRRPISRQDLLLMSDELRICADSIFPSDDFSAYPSFFEFMTAAAFLHFARGCVDCGVIEVGLGGRLDSTNILRPKISVITSIGLDHIQMLGSTIPQIAREKAGIIKRDTPVVCGFLPDDAMRVMEDTAARVDAPLYKVSDFFPSDSDLPETSLYGYYQRRNAAVALLCSRILREKVGGIFSRIDDRLARKSLLDVSWAARWQKIPLKNGATLVLDASHNEEGARTLDCNLSSDDFGGKKPVIVVGSLGSDRAAALLKVAAKHARKIILLVPDQPRALGFAELRAYLGDCRAPVVDGDVRKLFAEGGIYREVGRGDTVVSTGSIYLAGEVLAALDGIRADGFQDKPY